jgi:hypothetical protein
MPRPSFPLAHRLGQDLRNDTGGTPASNVMFGPSGWAPVPGQTPPLPPPPGPMSESERFASEIMSRLLLLEHGRQSLVDSLWASIAMEEAEEFTFTPGSLGGPILPHTSNRWMIRSILVSVPQGTTSCVLVVGNHRHIPIQNTFVWLPGVAMPIDDELSPRTLTLAPAVPAGQTAFVGLYGTMTPRTGIAT